MHRFGNYVQFNYGSWVWNAAPGSTSPFVFNGAAANDFVINVTGVASHTAATEYAGNGNVIGTTGFIVGQDGSGIARILQRANVTLTIGVNNATVMTFATSGGVFTAGATGGDQGAGTINATGLFVNGVAVGGATTGTFNATVTGGTGFGTVTCKWSKSGNAVTLFVPGFSGTSNANTFSFSNLPSAIQAATSQTTALVGSMEDNGAGFQVGVAITSGATLSFGLGTSSTSLSAWTPTGTKGINSQVWTWTTN